MLALFEPPRHRGSGFFFLLSGCLCRLLLLLLSFDRRFSPRVCAPRRHRFLAVWSNRCAVRLRIGVEVFCSTVDMRAV